MVCSLRSKFYELGVDNPGRFYEIHRAWGDGEDRAGWFSSFLFQTQMPGLKQKFTRSDKQRAASRERMIRMRREHPEKFVAQNTGHHRKPKVNTAEISAPVENPPPKPVANIPAPAPVPVITHAPIAPAPAPIPPEIPVATSPVKPDTEIFGSETVTPPKIDANNPPPPPKPPEGTPGSPPATPGAPAGSPPPPAAAPADSRKYAVFIWQVIVKICCAVFGEGFTPVTIKSPDGEVLYDESAEGVKVWWNFLVHVGVKAFSPVVELYIFMGTYFAMRFPLILAKFKKKKPATGTPPPSAPSEKPQAGTKKEEPQPPPPPESPPPSQQQQEPPKPAEARTVSTEEGED
jgi:hypothetical protein